MLILLTLLLVGRVLAAERYAKMVTSLTEGWLDRELEPVEKTHKIPWGQCSGIIGKNEYGCYFPYKLVTLKATARSNDVPVNIEFTDHFDAVKIYGCGPVYVRLETACVAPWRPPPKL